MGFFSSFRVRPDNMHAPDWVRSITSIFGYLDVEEQGKDKGVALADKDKVVAAHGENGDIIGAQFYGNMRRYINFEEPTKSHKLRVYRQMADYPEIKYAMSMICDEIMNYSDLDGNVGGLVIDNKNILENINKVDNIKKEWKYIFDELLNFKDTGRDAILSFLTSGELIYEKIVNPEKKSEGLKRVKRLRPDNVFPVWKTDLDGIEHFRIKDLNTSGTSEVIPKSQFSYVNWDSYYEHPETGDIYVVSYLEPVKKVWRQLQLLEEAVIIYRIVRAPERRVFKIATGNMPRAQAEQYVQKLMRTYRQKKIYNTSTGEIDGQNNIMAMLEDYWFSQPADGNSSQIETLPGGCLTLDTKIPLLDGRVIELEQIIKEHKEGKQNWVYSCDPKTGEIVPGPITNASITNRNAEVMKITLDNGKTVTCTLNHKWPTWNKGTVEAKELEIGDSFIPFNRKNESLKGSGNDYEYVFDNNTKEWKLTHQIVSRYMKDKGKENKKIFKEANKFAVIHHDDFNRFNNSPDNLMWMDAKDHFKMHSEKFGKYGKLGNEKHQYLYKNDDEYRQKCLDNFKQTWINKSQEELDIISKNCSKRAKNYIKNLNEDQKNKLFDRLRDMSTKGVETLNKMMEEDAELRAQILEKRGKQISKAKSTKKAKLNQSRISKNNFKSEEFRRKVFDPQTITFNSKMLKIISELYRNGYEKYEDLLFAINENSEFNKLFMELNSSVKRFKGFRFHHLKKILKQFNYDGWKDFKQKNELYNHTIVNIEYLEEKQVVANLTVDGNELYHDYHTYALDIGVFTKNSALGEITDLNYFLEKLYRALEIPINRRLDTTSGDQKYNVGNITDISWQEVKFSKMVTRIRRKVISCIWDVFKTHMKLKGLWDQYNLRDTDMHIELNKNNFFEEMKRAQVEETRLNAWGTVSTYVGDVFSKEMAVKHFLKWSNEDWNKNKQMLEKEKLEGNTEIEGGGGGPSL